MIISKGRLEDGPEGAHWEGDWAYWYHIEQIETDPIGGIRLRDRWGVEKTVCLGPTERLVIEA
jgi:hypothetical protein